MEAGMNDYISKPIAKGIIEKTIMKWMDVPKRNHGMIDETSFDKEKSSQE
jgi:PleD family two-component response regulator